MTTALSSSTAPRGAVLSTSGGAAALLLLAASALFADEPKNYTESIPTCKLSCDMVYIPGGTFNIGSPDAESGRRENEGPVRTVTVEPFWIGTYEVTWAEYAVFWQLEKECPVPPGVDAVTRPSAAYEPADHGWGWGRQPAIHLTWHAAAHYCRWLSRMTGRAYRLPTEAEWEFACRGGTSTPYFFGTDPASLGDYAWFKDNSGERTHEVGQKKPNPFGLHDMLGNALEYCLNPYTPNYPPDPTAWPPPLVKGLLCAKAVPEDKRCDPPCDHWIAGAAAPRQSQVVLRGGSFEDTPDALRSAARQPHRPEWNARNPQRPPGPWWLTDGQMCGFRLARSAKDVGQKPAGAAEQGNKK